ncbi:MAG: phage tail assembly chaperone [Candidatus Nanopelagicales bacterium]|nr:phage tail assembly chaperone [Candidatus Nanopelagicales bacterium]
MKFAKVVDGVAVTRPMSPMEALREIRTTVSRNITEADLTALLASHGYKPVDISLMPTIPPELMGRCIIKLGIPQVNPDGTLTRTYEFVEATQAQLNQASGRNRAKRDALLRTYVDSINAIRWSSMSAEKQTEWGAYRQALLDLPDQPGFPMNVSWPVKPT